MYKVLSGDKSFNGGEYEWSLPTKNPDGTWTPGEWTDPVADKLIPCGNGYHLCHREDLIQWLGPDIYEAEADNEIIEDDDKIVTRRARLLRKVEAWNDRTARLFAVWCAREELKLIDNPDPRSISACDVAERYANGAATQEELAAARAAAWVAAADAAWSAAWSAARAAEDAAADAAWSAAWSAAEAAAYAARSAVGAAQTEKLMQMLGEE